MWLIKIAILLLIKNSLAGLICYECWTTNINHELFAKAPLNLTDCNEKYLLRECIGEWEADRCFSYTSYEYKGRSEAKGCATESLLVYQIECQESKGKKGVHCNLCSSHLCNRGTNLHDPTVLIIVLPLICVY